MVIRFNTKLRRSAPQLAYKEAYCMNVISIVLDTFRHDIIGPGKKMSHVATPHLDQLASESVVFDRAFGEGQPTLQIRRAFFTGRRSKLYRHGKDRRGHWHHAPGWHKIPPEQDTLAEILSRHGYMTGLIADVYHMFKPTMNYWRGFTNYQFIRGQESDNYRGGTLDMVEEQMRKHVREPINWAKHSTLLQYLLNMRGREKEEDYLCGQVFTKACDWLEDNATNNPFMLWIEAFDPHEPWDPPAEYADQYCPGYDGKDFIMPGAGYEGGPMSDIEVERTKALYYGEVTFVDKCVGWLLNKIDEMKLWDDTIVLVLSDHGTQVYDKGVFGKGGNAMHPFNTGIVWQMRHPGGPKGKSIDKFVQSHDVMPTILDLLDVPYETEGTSVWPLVTGEVESIRNPIVCGWAEFANGNATARASVRTEKWNYVTAVGREEKNPELYDVQADPDEDANVVDQHPDVVAELRRPIEALVGQPIELRQNEVCDPEPSPMIVYVQQSSAVAKKG